MEVRPIERREAVRHAIEIHGIGWREAYRGIISEAILDEITVEPTPTDVDEWLGRLPAEDGVTLGAWADDELRGYLLARWTETKPFVGADEAGLKELYVHPDSWGEGFGTALLEACLERVPPDYSGIVLETLAENDLGRSFYEARGFDAVERRSLEIAGESYETVVYRRSL